MANHSKYALITGATNGIGYELARLFAHDKYNLVIVARHSDDLQRTAAELRRQYGVKVVPIAKDLFKWDAPFQLYEEIKSRGIQIDALVNNAGQGQYGQFVSTDINRDLDLIQLNIGAYVVLTKCFLQEMVNRNEGMILQVSSVAGELPGPLQAVYNATKAFVSSFTEAIRTEVQDTQVVITALLPGLTDTDFFRKADMERANMVANGSKADPAQVAKDGYNALQAGKNKVVSGLANKALVALTHVLPTAVVAATMYQQAKPIDGEEDARW